jgi:Outer membrane lipoprotein-sorting protein
MLNFFKRLQFLSVAMTAQFCCVAEDKTAEEILTMVRNSYVQAEMNLKAQVRDQESGWLESFDLSMAKQQVIFLFKNEPTEKVILDLTSALPQLFVQHASGEVKQIKISQSGQSLRKFKINYEDLSLRFLHWKQAEVLGSELIKAVSCWKVRCTAPDRSGPYGTVDLWVHKKSGGIAKMDAYDPLGKKVKNYQVISTQEIREMTMLKQMRLEAYDADSGKSLGRTYIEILGE